MCPFSSLEKSREVVGKMLRGILHQRKFPARGVRGLLWRRQAVLDEEALGYGICN